MHYFRKGTTTSPAVIMDHKTKSALISGKSICTDIVAYASVVVDIKQQMEQFAYTDLNINLKVFNTPAAKSLLDIMKSIKYTKGKAQTAIHWHCEKEDAEMQEMASYYSQLLEIDIDILYN